MEIMPPSFTGDPNSARSDETAFRFPFLCMNAALLYNRMGLHNVLTFGPSVNGDYLLALAEEKRATSEEAKGKPAYHRKDKLGGFLHRRTVRWQKERMIQNM
jgi:hypothetical protein|tara:strand:- start:1109 stop:1414 length:306 start_codon:yes stop_codon:yes gene_type:complete|mmetsp:Transcript_7155/g.26976  ORF Transcript_7155/g.26976 Transcript_7155/m.26976 type:complete len:102 (+) Transcript_7155:228-533(+)